MRFFLILIMFLLPALKVKAQVDHFITTDYMTILDSVPVLIDKNYSFEEILNNSNLRFDKKSEIRIKGVTSY